MDTNKYTSVLSAVQDNLQTLVACKEPEASELVGDVLRLYQKIMRQKKRLAAAAKSNEVVGKTTK